MKPIGTQCCPETEERRAERRAAIGRAFGDDPPAPGDWTEDAHHENGKYIRACVACSALFIGHKRRFTCKTCKSREPVRDFSDLSPEMQKAVIDKMNELFHADVACTAGRKP